MKNYIIDYQLIKDQKCIKKGTFKVKRCLDELHAKFKFDEFISKLYDFDNLVIDYIAESNMITDLFGSFK